MQLRNSVITARTGGFDASIVDQERRDKLLLLDVTATQDYDTFKVDLPNEYFEEDLLPIDIWPNGKPIGITDKQVAKDRCAHAIVSAHQNWIDNNPIFTAKSIWPILQKAIYELYKAKGLSLLIGRNETAMKYLVVWLTEKHLPSDASNNDKYFVAEIKLSEYYDTIGDNMFDNDMGVAHLKGKSKEDICLLRIAYKLYTYCIEWLKDKWPDVYKEFKKGKKFLGA